MSNRISAILTMVYVLFNLCRMFAAAEHANSYHIIKIVIKIIIFMYSEEKIRKNLWPDIIIWGKIE